MHADKHSPGQRRERPLASEPTSSAAAALEVAPAAAAAGAGVSSAGEAVEGAAAVSMVPDPAP